MFSMNHLKGCRERAAMLVCRGDKPRGFWSFPINFLVKKCNFLSLELAKWNFTTVGHPLKKSAIGPSGKSPCRTSCDRWLGLHSWDTHGFIQLAVQFACVCTLAPSSAAAPKQLSSFWARSVNISVEHLSRQLEMTSWSWQTKSHLLKWGFWHLAGVYPGHGRNEVRWRPGQEHRHSQEGAMPPKFLENIVILCFERHFSKQNNVIRLKSNIPPQIFGLATPLGKKLVWRPYVRTWGRSEAM